ncbi:Type II secretion system protein OS=Streptomyces tendae OX=1932 GN=GUR47_17990 PE=4 SV=1 [Streptomyces tendae]
MNDQLTMPVVVGAVVGLGVYVLVRALMPTKRSALSQVARIDAMRARGTAYESARTTDREPSGRFASLRAQVGEKVAEIYRQQGWEQRSLRADLAVLERSWEKFLATKVLLAVAGLFFGPFLFAIVWQLGFGSSPVIPVWLALLCAVLFFVLPDLEVRRDAAEKRRDLRRVIGAYLDLVSMSLAGGRGLPEALMAAAEVSDGWATQRIRNALADARFTGMFYGGDVVVHGQAVAENEVG